jgi:hypothetical protein
LVGFEPLPLVVKDYGRPMEMLGRARHRRLALDRLAPRLARGGVVLGTVGWHLLCVQRR